MSLPMLRFFPVLLLAAFAAEIASIIWVGGRIGVAPTLLLLLAGGVAGLRLIKAAGVSVAEALRSPVQTGTPLRGLGGPAAARAVSGLLLLVPGFCSDILALLLFLPPVRRWIGSRFRIHTFTPPRADGQRFQEVIDAEAVEIIAEVEPPRDPGPR